MAFLYLCAPTGHHSEIMLLSDEYVVIPAGDLCKLIEVCDLSEHTFGIHT